MPNNRTVPAASGVSLRRRYGSRQDIRERGLTRTSGQPSLFCVSVRKRHLRMRVAEWGRLLPAKTGTCSASLLFGMQCVPPPLSDVALPFSSLRCSASLLLFRMPPMPGPFPGEAAVSDPYFSEAGTGILAMRRSWRPPSYSAAKKASSIRMASSLLIKRAGKTMTLALLC